MVSTKPNTSGACDARLSLPSTVWAAAPSTRTVDAADGADGAGDDVAAQLLHCGLRLSFGPSPTIGSGQQEHGAVVAGLRRERLDRLARRTGLLLEGGDAVLHAGGRDVLGLDDEIRAGRCPGNAAWRWSNVFITGKASRGMSSMPVTLVCMPIAGKARAASTATPPTSATTGRRSTWPSTKPQMRESRSSRFSRRRIGRRLLWTRSPSLASTAGSTVSEPSTATPTTTIEPTAMLPTFGVAHQEHPGERGHHGQAGDEHRVAAGGGCGLERGQLAGATGALLALPLEVEQRVVDADGHADQHHQDLGALTRRDELAGQRRQAEGREYRGEAEQHRDAGGQHGAEGDTRMIRVIGTDSVSAFWKSEASLSSNCLPPVASPKPSISRAG